MPELPEVETTRRGLDAHLRGQTVRAVEVRDRRLRWPVDEAMARELPGQRIVSVDRRAKYLLLRAKDGTLIVHLGMSGSLQVVRPPHPLHRHDHIVWDFANGLSVRYRDHRRFGAALWTRENPLAHPLLRSLGPEPLGNAFHGGVLYERSRGRRAPVKAFVMDARVVVGVGNIYASEALYRAGIHPLRPAGRISRVRYELLAESLRNVLRESIDRGGTTLRDFVGSDGAPGYFVEHLDVYGRSSEPCRRCGTALKHRKIAQRSTVYCPSCQR